MYVVGAQGMLNGICAQSKWSEEVIKISRNHHVEQFQAALKCQGSGYS